MSDENKGSSKELAEDRTDWAEDRTVLANERTFLSWNGTALGSIGLAVGLQAVFGETDPTWLAKLTASVFISIALVLIIIGYRKAVATCQRLSSHSAESAASFQFLLVATCMCIGALTTGFILWML